MLSALLTLFNIWIFKRLHRESTNFLQSKCNEKLQKKCQFKSDLFDGFECIFNSFVLLRPGIFSLLLSFLFRTALENDCYPHQKKVLLKRNPKKKKYASVNDKKDKNRQRHVLELNLKEFLYCLRTW